MTQRENVVYEFGPFQLDARQRLLFRDGQLVHVSPKTIETLAILVSNPGQLLEKDELIRRIWPNTIVEESNLAIQISLLRKILVQAMTSDPIATIPKRGYRFIASVRIASSVEAPAVLAAPPAAAPEPLVAEAEMPRRRWLAIAAASLLLAMLLLVTLLPGVLRPGRRPAPQPASPPAAAKQDAPPSPPSVLLADIQNETKEAAFDSTLRQALSIQLEQSPSLSLVSDQEIQHLLAMMKQPKTAHLSPELAWELCQRGGNTVVIYPSIANLADQYILGLRALDCRTGNSLANQQSAATGKDHVLQAVDEAATELRRRLGESLPQLQRYNTPIEQATTPSLAALQAYSVGWLMQYRRGDSAGAVAFFQRAVQLDPGFAMAYAALGQTYSNRYEPAEAAKYLKRAYALREHVTERERFYIESRYERAVSGDLEKARLVNQQWAQVYPLDAMPRTSLALIDRYLGQYDRALSEASEANRLAPDSSQGYANLAFSYLLLNRLDEAKAVDDEAQARNLDSPLVRLNLYFLASLRNDRSAVEQLDAWSAGQAGVEDRFLNQKSLDLAHDGHISKALDVSQAAVASALRTGARETAAGYEAAWAVLEGIVGNDTDARRYATAALALAQDRDSEFWAALAMAMAADNARAQALGDSLSKELPEDTAVRFCFVPTIRAQLALNAGNAAQAIEILEATRPYELGKVTGLYPVYIRGEALRSVQRLDEAAVEFQKIIDRPGVVLNDPIGELALLQLARVYAAQGLREKAATAYQGFLAPWQEAGTSIPLVAKAQSELAGLKSIGP